MFNRIQELFFDKIEYFNLRLVKAHLKVTIEYNEYNSTNNM